ncbi:MAG: YfhO family protein, partial [Lachnospiraceae bacterium]|nr:YfhO family protein [Lachnospiraceae bacterium]
LASLSAYPLVERRSQEDGAEMVGFAALLMSCFYAMSGYVAAYNYNIMWLDCIILAPIILLGLERLVKNEKVGLYVLSLASCIFTNFYLSIMICLFLVMYFFYLFLAERKTKEERLRALWQFALGSVMAGAMAGVLLVPEVFALKGSDFGTMSFPEKWERYFNTLQVLARHCMGITPETEMDHWPNIYCGVAVFFLIPLYLMNKGIPRRKRIGFFVMAVFLLLSFEFNVLEFLWHGMNYPDCLPARQSFLYILLVLIMCHECLVHLKEISVKWLVAAFVAALGMVFCIERFLKSDDFHPRDCYVTMLFITLYAICLFLYRSKVGKRMADWLAVISYVLVLAECTLNMSWTSVVTTDRAMYYDQMQDYQNLVERNSSADGDFKRFEMFSGLTRNDSAILGFPSATMFASTLNARVKELYVRLGMRYGKVFYSAEGATALTGALLNVDYLFSSREGLDGEIYQLADEENGIELYETKYALPFGYVAPYGFVLEEGVSVDPIALQEDLTKRLGIEGTLFHEAGQNEDDGSYACEMDGFYYGLLNASELYRITIKGTEEWGRSWRFLKRNSVLLLGDLKAGQEIRLIDTDTGETLKKGAVTVYRLDTEVLGQVIKTLSKEHLTDVKVEETNVSGRLELEAAGRLITSVPYEKGWTVYVNGEKRTPQRFGDALIALDLDAGTYEIEMKYVPEGSRLGWALSILGMICFLCYEFFIDRKRSKDEG